MSYQSFSKYKKIKVIDASTEKIGGFDVASAIDLKYLVLGMYFKGAGYTTERFRLHVYGTNKYSSPIFSSDWVNVSDISGFSGGNWLGAIRFSFSTHPINPNFQYFLKIEAGNYTRSANTKYAAVVLDYPEPANTLASANNLAPEVRVIGYV